MQELFGMMLRQHTCLRNSREAHTVPWPSQGMRRKERLRAKRGGDCPGRGCASSVGEDATRNQISVHNAPLNSLIATHEQKGDSPCSLGFWLLMLALCGYSDL